VEYCQQGGNNIQLAGRLKKKEAKVKLNNFAAKRQPKQSFTKKKWQKIILPNIT